MVNPVVVMLTQTACVAAKLAVAALAGVMTTTGADEKAVLYVIVANTALIEGLDPVVRANNNKTITMGKNPLLYIMLCRITICVYVKTYPYTDKCHLKSFRGPLHNGIICNIQ